MEKLKDLAKMDRKEIAARTYQRQVYNALIDLRIAIYQANRAEIAIGDLAQLDTDHFLRQVKKEGNILNGSDREKRLMSERPDIVPIEAPVVDVTELVEVEY